VIPHPTGPRERDVQNDRLEELRIRFRETLAASGRRGRRCFGQISLARIEADLDARFWTNPLLARLTWREHDVLLLISIHLQDKEIADELGISICTVRSYVSTAAAPVRSLLPPGIGRAHSEA
jgi:DNA-binding NarL/FixJ family response regulator